MSENITTEQALKAKNKRLDLKYRKEINKLEAENKELSEKLLRWQEDNRQLQQDNIELMNTVKTINVLLRGIMFGRCDKCGTEWKRGDIKKMMKTQVVDCPGCDLAVQVK